MRAMLISSALAAAFALSAPVIAAPTSLLPAEPEAAQPSSSLAPLAADSAWTARFAAAADELATAFRSREEAQWAPLLGGQWLSATDRERVKNLLSDRTSPFLPALFSKGLTQRAILGWHAPASLSADERAAIEGGQEAEALVCWSAGNGTGPWPATAVEADNRPGRSYACARIAYSIRGETPTWRAFIEQGEGGALAAASAQGDT
ncbi:MAG: hypothetical protein EOP63_19560 [Sphingomonadales bacterium]|nr:MAG: hypothetical protein EOP63_19560 [Sphingomonadales bacterium]